MSYFSRMQEIDTDRQLAHNRETNYRAPLIAIQMKWEENGAMITTAGSKLQETTLGVTTNRGERKKSEYRNLAYCQYGCKARWNFQLSPIKNISKFMYMISINTLV